MTAVAGMLGYEIMVANAGETALHAIRREEPDLVVLASMFPGRGIWRSLAPSAETLGCSG